MSLATMMIKRRFGASLLALVCVALMTTATTQTAEAQEGPGTIELETIEIESEVPRRVAQFFVQRDHLHYQPLDDQPTFVPELLQTVEEEPF